MSEAAELSAAAPSRCGRTRPIERAPKIGCSLILPEEERRAELPETAQDAWSRPVNLGPTVNSEYVQGEPALSPDGTELYFNSNRPGGFGGRDLYVTRRQQLKE